MISTVGIVLNSVRYTDDKVIVNVFTRSAGGMGFVVKRPGGAAADSRRGSRRSAAASGRAAVWQPLTLVEMVYDERLRGGLARVREVRIARPWVDMPYHPHKASMSLFLGEFLGHVLRSEPANGELMDFLVEGLAWLDSAQTGFASFHVVMLLGLSRFLGFEPNVSGWKEGSFFDLRDATYSEWRPTHPDYIEGDEAALAARLLRLGYGQMRRVRLSGAARSRMLEVIVWFYRLHVPELPEMKSLAVLREMFGTVGGGGG